MSLYDESIEVVEYGQMLNDIKRNRETIDQIKRWIHPLKDRPDIAIDSKGETWIVAPVSKNVGVFVPIFYRFTYCPKAKVRHEIRPMRTGRVSKYRDETPKTAKPTKR